MMINANLKKYSGMQALAVYKRYIVQFRVERKAADSAKSTWYAILQKHYDEIFLLEFTPEQMQDWQKKLEDLVGVLERYNELEMDPKSRILLIYANTNFN